MGLAVGGLVIAAVLGVSVSSLAVEPSLVNLGRLSIALVSASGVEGGRPLEDPLHGVRNLFDAGRDVWSSDAPPHWVRVRFQKPVTVHRVTVETGEERAPRVVQVELRSASGVILKASGPFTIVRDRTTYDPSRPIKGVRAVRLLFSGPASIQVNEIEILGEVPRGTVVVEAVPAIDGDAAGVRP